ncbi:MAG: hypothetical protein WDO12_02615 [Pseudomonadota bacterium]
MTALTISKSATIGSCALVLLAVLPPAASAQSNNLAATWGTQGRSCQAPPATTSPDA